MSDEVFAAVRAAHPAGATLEEIAAAVGCGREAIRLIEASALRRLLPRAKLAGLEWSEPTHRACITDDGEGGEYNGTQGAHERVAAVTAARRAEAMATSPLIARLIEELDHAADRGRRVALFLGAVRERLEFATCPEAGEGGDDAS